MLRLKQMHGSGHLDLFELHAVSIFLQLDICFICDAWVSKCFAFDRNFQNIGMILT